MPFFFFLKFFLFFFFFFNKATVKIQKLHNCLYILLRNQWMLRAAEILVETLT